MAEIRHDPAKGLDYIADDGTGQLRYLSMLQGRPMALPEFKTYHAPIPQSEWVEIDMLGTFNPPTEDQGQRGSCTGHGAAIAFALVWAGQGEDMLRFSACFLYGLINGDRDAGASISDTIGALQKYGICLATTVPEGMIFRRQFPASAYTEAANYKLLEAYKTSDPADVATALQMGYAVADSVMVGRSFNNLNSEGVAGVDRGPGNHCIAKAGMKRLAKGWAYINQNSWGERWGNSGRFLTTDAHIQSQGYYEAVIFRAVSPGPDAFKFA